MTIKSNKDYDVNGSKSKDNIFQIMDGIIAQLNRTKKYLSIDDRLCLLKISSMYDLIKFLFRSS